MSTEELLKPITSVNIASIFKDFQNAYDALCHFHGCAFCGRKFSGTPSFVNIYHLPDLFRLTLPLECGHQTHYSSCNFAFALYPKFVTVNGEANACPDCLSSIETKQVPVYSLANGFDFNISNLPELNILEKHLISKNILFGNILRLSLDCTNSEQPALKGHILSVPHDGIAIGQLLPRSDLATYLTIVFENGGGPKNHFRKVFDSSYPIRSEHLFTWLTFLKENNSEYRDIEINYQWSSHEQLDLLWENAIFDHDCSGTSSEFLDQGVSTEPIPGRVDNIFVPDSAVTSATKASIFDTIRKIAGVKIPVHSESIQSDFYHLSEVILKTFPWLFPFSCPFPKDPLQPKFVEYLLSFHDNRFSDSSFLFYLYSVHVRRLASLNVSVKVKNTSNCLNQFRDIIKDPGFKTNISSAIKNPESPVAQSLFAKLSTIIKTTTKNLPFSVSERTFDRSKMEAYLRYFGSPTIFFTMSPSCIHQKVFFSITSCSNRDSMFTIPSLNDKWRIFSENPVAAAQTFDIIQKLFFEQLFGMPRVTEYRKTVPVESRNGKLFGLPKAFFSVTEANSRGNLHFHSLLWCGPDPSDVQRRVHDPAFVDDFVRYIDSVVTASIPMEIHNTFSQVQDKSSLLFSDPSVSSLDAFPEESYKVALTVNNHIRHTSTCYKGKQGAKGCRLNCPFPLSATTAPSEIFFYKNGDSKSFSLASHHYPISTPPAQTSFPCPSDQRIITFDQKRENPQDSTMVSFNPMTTFLFRCNSAVYPLYNESQAIPIVYYLKKYFTKETTTITRSLSALLSAVSTSKQSTAPDKSTETRKTQFLLTRLLNCLHAKEEISAPMAAATLLQMGSSTMSHDVWLCFPSQLQNHDNFNVNYDFRNCNSFDSEIPETDFASLGDIASAHVPDDLPDNEDETCLNGYSDISLDRKDEPVFVDQHINYLYRGDDLKLFSLFEYCGCVTIVPKRQSKVSTGRQQNKTFDFHPMHPKYLSHVQRLRSKLAVPVVSGPIQHHPGPFKSTSAWESQATKWTNFILCLFIPWDTATFTPSIHSYSALIGFINNLLASENPMDVTKALTIYSYSRDLHPTKLSRKALAMWRGRARDIWANVGKPGQPGDLGVNMDGNLESEALVSDDILVIDEESFQNRVQDQKSMETTRSLEKIFSPIQLTQSMENTFSPKNSGAFDVESVDNSIQKLKEADQNDTNAFTSQGKSSKFCQNRAFKKRYNQIRRKLTHNQQAIFDRIYLHFSSSAEHLNNNPLNLFVHGSPGTGKSFLIQSICELLGSKFVSCSAPTGIVATQMINGRTINSMFDINPSYSDRVLKPEKLQRLLNRFDGKILIIIDEISMMDPTLLAFIHLRMQQLKQRMRPFGSMSILLVGDFFQVDPVKGTSLYKALFDMDNMPADSLNLLGAQLFADFDRMDLTEQVRSAKDIAHTNFVSSLRMGHEISMEQLESIKELTSEDITTDSLWEFAPIVTATNAERIAINILQLKRFAVKYNTVILRWKNPLKSSHGSMLTVKVTNLFYNNCNELYSYFTVGAPCFVTHNIVPLLGVANGTAATLHSVTCSSLQLQEQLKEMVSASKPGDIIEIPCPYAVNVDVGQSTVLGKLSLVTGASVLALPLQRIYAHDLDVLGVTVKYFSFPFTLGFSVTFHKVQGKTLKRVILSLNHRKGFGRSTISYNCFLVGVSRVTCSAHLRRLPKFSQEDLFHVTKLRPSPELLKWSTAYKNGIFQTSPCNALNLSKEVNALLWDDPSTLSFEQNHFRTVLQSHPNIHICMAKYGHLPTKRAISFIQKDVISKKFKKSL